MQEIKTNWDELSFLRKTINSKCKQRTSRELDIKSSLNAYSNLAEDMARFVQPDSHTSEGLLRKLFYDTREDDYTIFRLSFLDTCYKYISDNQYTRAEYLRNQKNKDKSPVPRSVVIPGTLLIVLIPVIYFLFADSERFVPFEEDFDDVSKAGLLERGWMILDEDSTYLHKQLKEGYLTLYTLAGDYWVKEGEEKLIKNVLVKKINCRNCWVELKVDSFYPKEKWQQVELMFFDSPYDRENFVCINYVYYHGLGKDTSGNRLSKQISVWEMKNGSVVDPEFVKFSEPYPTVRLIAEKQGNKITFYRSFKHKWEFAFILDERNTSLEFNYLGIAARHGWTNDDTTPLAADTIPAYIDYVKVEAID